MDALYYQCVIQMRIPIKEDGLPGKPEVVKRFVTPFKGAKSNDKLNKPKPKPLTTQKVEETYF